WQKNGFGIYWETYEKEGRNPRTGEIVPAVRQRLRQDRQLPLGKDYGRFVLAFLPGSGLR
ncbi:MAG TPA: guanylyltransferase, partial [Thermoanaerobaculia bacterium]